MRSPFFYSIQTGKVVILYEKRIVSGELGMKDEAQYSHDSLMIKYVHLMTGTPSFYIQHYHGTSLLTVCCVPWPLDGRPQLA